jgi:hypothetical protein
LRAATEGNFKGYVVYVLAKRDVDPVIAPGRHLRSVGRHLRSLVSSIESHATADLWTEHQSVAARRQMLQAKSPFYRIIARQSTPLTSCRYDGVRRFERYESCKRLSRLCVDDYARDSSIGTSEYIESTPDSGRTRANLDRERLSFQALGQLLFDLVLAKGEIGKSVSAAIVGRRQEALAVAPSDPRRDV